MKSINSQNSRKNELSTIKEYLDNELILVERYFKAEIQAIERKQAAEGMYGSGSTITSIRNAAEEQFKNAVEKIAENLQEIFSMPAYKIYRKNKINKLIGIYLDFCRRLYKNILDITEGKTKEILKNTAPDREMEKFSQTVEETKLYKMLKFQILLKSVRKRTWGNNWCIKLLWSSLPTLLGAIVGFVLGRI